MAAGMERWAGPEGVEQWRATGRREFSHELVTCELGWELLEDLWTYDLDQLAASLACPALILQGKNDTSVDWRAVTEFAAACQRAAVELHLFGDGDHRLVDRLDHLASLVFGFLAARGLDSVVADGSPGPASTSVDQ